MLSSLFSDYPPVSFHFSVSFIGLMALTDYKFQEVDGIGAEISVEEIKEGGENRFSYQVPIRSKFNTIELKRGLVPAGSLLAKWCTDTLTDGFSEKIVPMTLLVSLLDESAIPIMAWKINNAWPIGWNVSKLNAQENTIAIESIKLSCTHFNTISLNL